MKKVRLLALAIITTSLFMLSGCADDGSSGGSSTVNSLCTNLTGVGYDNSSGTWEIYNANGLKAFRDEVNGGDSDLHAKLVCDIALDNTTSWERISIYGGTFDGDNHTISNLFIDNDTVEHQGLFFVILPDGVVKNLKLKDVDITSSNFVGSLAAQNQGLVQNVHVDNVTIDANTIIGGVVGWNNIGDIIMSSANNVTLTARGAAGNDGTGGVVGVNDALLIGLSANDVDITATTGIYVGGVAGRNLNVNSVLILSYATSLTFDTPSTNIGGVTGNNGSSVAISNFFISEDPTLFGIGGATPNDDNATRVDDIQTLNNDIEAMNEVINDYELANSIAFGYRWQAGNSTSELPTVVEHTTPIQSIALSYPTTNILEASSVSPTIVITPTNTTNRAVKYTSSDNDIASVDEKTGVVTGKSQGSATIRATSTHDASIYDEVEITVLLDPCLNTSGIGYIYNTTSGIWEIYNANGLIALRVNQSQSAKLICDIDLQGSDSNQWLPIKFYDGTFDGDNHTISNLFINNNSERQGLFGYILENGVVKNLKLKDVEVTGTYYIGSLAGENSGIVSNVHVDNVTITSNGYVAGGISGSNEGWIYMSTANDVTITVEGTSGIEGSGGIVGVNYKFLMATSANNVNITEKTGKNVGGVAGRNNNTTSVLISSFASNLTFDTAASANLGGVAGNIGSSDVISNFFVSTDENLYGIGDLDINDNATRVDNIQSLNDNVTKMNKAINDYELANKVAFGYRWQAGNSATELPTLVEQAIPIQSVELSYPSNMVVTSTLTPTITFTPLNATQSPIKYTSSDDGIASVDENTGVVTGVAQGLVTIKATLTNDESIYDEVEINVQDIPADRCDDVNGLGYDNINGVFEINNAKGLNTFRDEVNNVNSALHAKLVCNITLDTTTQWILINNYSGTFDGNNHTISGIRINDNTLDRAGLFSVIKTYGIVKNLHVTDANITASEVVGAIVGSNEGTILSSSVTNARLTVNTIFDGYVGGIAGESDSIIVGAYADNITLNANNSASGNALGGIIGYNTIGSDIVASYTNRVSFNNNETIGGIVGITEDNLNTNFFINSNSNLYGIGESFIDGQGSNVNAERLDNIQLLNDKVTEMNSAIDEFERDNGVTVDMRWQAGANVVSNLPILVFVP